MVKLFVRFFSLLPLLILVTFCREHITESTPSIDENMNNEIIPTFSDIQKNVFDNSCALSGCHVANSINPNLSDNSYNRIVNKKSSNGIDYIKPNDPENSYLLQKIIGSNSINGSRMPRSSSPLSQATINSITTWINNGAKND